MRKFCKTVALGLCVGALFLTQAQTFVRGNLAGYYPSAEKRIVVMSSSDISAKTWKITGENGAVEKQGTIGKSIAKKSDHTPFDYNYEISFSDLKKEGDYTFAIDGENNAQSIKITKNPYGEAISSSLRWLRVQRSGTKDVLDRLPAHFGDSAAIVYYRSGNKKTDEWKEDEDGKTIDLQGGWYAATDYTKSTPLIAHTVYFLLRAYNLAPETFEKKYSKSSLVDILDEAKFGLEYLLKVMPNDKDFIINVGGYDSENGVRLPHEDVWEGKRPAYSILSSSCMGAVSTALALGSQTFKDIDAAFAKKCKDMAIKIFDRATAPGVKPEWLEKDEWPLNPDESDKDNLLMAAAALYDLTKDEVYLAKAKSFSDGLGAAYWAGWDTQNLLAHSLIADKHANAKKFALEDLNGFLSNQRAANNIWNLPLEYTNTGLYGCLIIGIGAGNYIKQFNDKTYDGLVIDVLNYNFGLNNWGVSFTTVKSIKESVKNYNLPIYRLQTKYYPEGSVAGGPCDRPTHAEESVWIMYDVRIDYCYPFNTPAVVFYDYQDDYVTMGSRSSGGAKNIYLMTLANTLFGGK